MDFTVRHDDGRNVQTLDEAEIVLVGVSRTSKTPLSIYLAYRGWKVANVPIVLNQPLPENLSRIPSFRVVGLVAQPAMTEHARSPVSNGFNALYID